MLNGSAPKRVVSNITHQEGGGVPMEVCGVSLLAILGRVDECPVRIHGSKIIGPLRIIPHFGKVALEVK